MNAAFPISVRRAGWIVAVQGALGLLLAIVLIVRAAMGADQSLANGYGTAAWFGIFGVVVLAAGRALITGKRWGRGVAVVLQLLLLPVAWYATVESHRPVLGVPLGIVALAVLVLLFSPSAQLWATGHEADGETG